MAAKKKAKSSFKQIVIKSEEQLDSILDRFNDSGLDVDDFVEAAQFILNPTPEQALKHWADDHFIDICDDGLVKIVKAAGTVTTWPQYFEKHWNDGDGILDWLDSEGHSLTGQSVEVISPTTYGNNGYVLENSDYYQTFAAFRKANPGLKFIAFPLKSVGKKSKKR